MRRIIPLPLADRTISGRLCNAAWHFMCAVLWPEQSFDDEEHKRSIVLIRTHLDYPIVMEARFIEFYERLLLAHEAINLGQPNCLPQPSVWLQPHYLEGYSATNNKYQRLLYKRLDVPGYRSDYFILVSNYYKYSYGNRRSTLVTCRRILLRLNAFDLLSLLYRTIFHYSFFHSKLI
ncbi:hypothetical protein C7475_112160 [Chitinophaga sp. S165]|nr:hypothetical protein C7475_112160 [Chitinophaga sp. S165]